LFSFNREEFFSSITRELGIAFNRVTLKANSAGNYFVLLDWVNYTVLLSSRDHEIVSKYLSELAVWQSTLLERCFAQTQKKSLKASAIRSTRASLRAIFQQKDDTWNVSAIESYIKILTTPKVSPFIGCLSLGVAAGVCKRLRSDTPRKVVESSKSIIYDFFIKEIVGSRVSVPGHVMVWIYVVCADLKDEFSWFIEGFTTQDDFDKIVAPALERGILRSPELVLSGYNTYRYF
jgi:hypothetical protein